MTESFDPFSDRTARDIRNALSSGLVDQLTRRPGESAAEVAAVWLDKADRPVYRAYIRRRLRQYDQVVSRIQGRGIRDPRCQALELWNHELFFELHELLETVWHGARGVERTGLKGLIQAAGAYVHQQRGNQRAAQGLARRACSNIAAGLPALAFIANLGSLTQHLNDMSRPPPKLEALPLAGSAES